MTFGAGQGSLSPVDISRDSLIFPEVFITNTSTVTGYTVILSGGRLAELVSGNKPTTCLIRPADVALTAGSMVLLTVISKGCSQWGTLFRVPSPSFKSGFHSAYCSVKATLIHVGNIFVAGVAIPCRRISYQTNMG